MSNDINQYPVTHTNLFTCPHPELGVDVGAELAGDLGADLVEDTFLDPPGARDHRRGVNIVLPREMPVEGLRHRRFGFET